MNKISNQVTLIGYLGKDPEKHEFDPDKVKTSFSLATTEVYYNKDGDRVSNTQWHNCIAWGKMAERIEAGINKGSRIAVNGKLTYRSYEGQDNQKRHITEVIVQDYAILDKKESQ